MASCWISITQQTILLNERKAVMKNNTWKSIKLAIKISLCISLVAVGLLLNYVKNLNPAQDGFSVSDLIPRLIHGDDYWTWEKLTTGLYISWSVFTALFCVDKLLCLIGRVKK